MSLLSEVFGRKSPIDDKPVEHAVIVNFDYGGSTDLQPIFALESELAAAIDAAKAGEYDGHEVAVLSYSRRTSMLESVVVSSRCHTATRSSSEEPVQ